MKGSGRVEEIKKSKRGTIGTKEAEQDHMRGKPVGQKMYSKGTKDGKQMYNRSTTEALHRTKNT